MLQPFTCRLIVVIHGRRVITKRECFTGSAEIFQVCVGLLAHPWNFLRTICLKTRGPLQAIGLQRGCFAQLGAASVFARCLYGENLHWFCSIKVGQSTCARFYIIYCLHLDRTEFWQVLCSSVLACFCWIASLRSLFIRGLPSSLWKAHKLMQLGNEGDMSKRPSKGKRCHM